MSDGYFGGFFRRFTAFMIDQFFLAMLYTAIFFVSAKLLGIDMYSLLDFATWRSPQDMNPLLLSYYGMTTILNMTYFTYFHGTTGQTPGKKILGLRVERTDGEAMTAGIAFLRWVGYFVSAIVLYLGYLWVIVDRKKQAWHDKIAGTVVVRTSWDRPASTAVEAEKIP